MRHSRVSDFTVYTCKIMPFLRVISGLSKSGFYYKPRNLLNWTACFGRSRTLTQVRHASSAVSPGHRISAITTNNDSVSVSWTDGSTADFHHIWLRDHCRCSQCYNSTTHQKELNIVDIPVDIKPFDVSLNGPNSLSIKWPDSHETDFDAEWLKQNCYGKQGAFAVTRQAEQKQKHFLWDKNSIETNLPCPLQYGKITSDHDELSTLFFRIVKYGFAFVEDTPTTVDAVENVSKLLGGFVKETHYGKVWEFSNEVMEHADTAYTSDYLRGHVDSTYFSHPAGLQLLHCVGHEGTGGLNLLVDGFFAAEKLRQEDKASFEILSSTIARFHYKDEDLHLKAHGPIIETDPFDGSLSQIRFNNYDMDVMDWLKYDEVTQFYKALRAYSAITCAPENQFWFKLVPGLLLIMGNWRVLHGRSSFTGKRTMQGCYINGDDFFGKYRAKVLSLKKT